MISFYFSFTQHFWKHWVFDRHWKREINIFHSPIKIIDLNFSLPFKICITLVIQIWLIIAKIWNVFWCKIITFINLIVKDINLGYFHLPNQIVINFTTHCLEFYIFAVLQHRFNTNNTLYGNVLTIWYSKLLWNSPNFNIVTVSYENSAVARSNKNKGLLASINKSIFYTFHDNKLAILTSFYRNISNLPLCIFNFFINIRQNEHIITLDTFVAIFSTWLGWFYIQLTTWFLHWTLWPWRDSINSWILFYDCFAFELRIWLCSECF